MHWQESIIYIWVANKYTVNIYASGLRQKLQLDYNPATNLLTAKGGKEGIVIPPPFLNSDKFQETVYWDFHLLWKREDDGSWWVLSTFIWQFHKACLLTVVILGKHIHTFLSLDFNLNWSRMTRYLLFPGHACFLSLASWGKKIFIVLSLSLA